jgi:hypothetical protein
VGVEQLAPFRLDATNPASLAGYLQLCSLVSCTKLGEELVLDPRCRLHVDGHSLVEVLDRALDLVDW